jgi:hypothetical protein
MAVGSRYTKVAVSATTNTRVVTAQPKTSSLKMIFVSSGTDATSVKFADSSASLTAGNGFPVLVAKSQGAVGVNDWELVPDEELWILTDQAGTLYIRNT